MQPRRKLAILLCALTCWFLAAKPEASRANGDSTSDAAAVRELLEGAAGRRETWTTAPALVIETSVLDFASGAMSSGYAALDKKLSDAEVAQLTSDLTQALDELTAGTFKAFRTISVETAPPGEVVKVLRAGHIVVGRFRGVQEKTGNLGYSGRMTRNSTITSAAVVLDAAFDRQSDRRQLRTHELGHALGYNHVQSRQSVMNPRVGSSMTDFDRAAIRQAFAEGASQK